jgi:hypothetical protein
MSSRVARESKSNETGSFRDEVFGLNDLCRRFANPVHYRPWCEAAAEARSRGNGSN